MILPIADLLGFWLGIFLTFCVLSFLYKDNPFYKFAEHVFIGISLGYVVVIQYENVIRPELIDSFADTDGFVSILLWGVPIVLVLLMFMKLSKRFGWVGRYPLAFVVALYAGLQVNNVPNADLVKQLPVATQSIVAHTVNLNTASRKALVQLPGFSPATADAVIARRAEKVFESVEELYSIDALDPTLQQRLDGARGVIQGLDARVSVTDGEVWAFGTFSRILLLLGLVASLVYFYFSIAQGGAVGKVSRFGVWVLMLGFGASFGYTVQGRIALAIGRALDVLGRDKDPAIAAQIGGAAVALVSIVILVVGIVVWERKTNSDLTGSDSANGED